MSWFGWVKRLFTCEAKPQKPKKWRYCNFGMLKLKQYSPALAAPEDRSKLAEATAEQRRHALTAAIATAAAAEAAVAAAHAAADVVRLTGASHSRRYLSKADHHLAAVKIQSAYRAHLARKALRGVVRLQALVRGRAVRHQLPRRMKHLPSGATRLAKVEARSAHRYWDCSSRSKEEIEAMWLRKEHAILNRERIKKYSFSHRERRNHHPPNEPILNMELRRNYNEDAQVSFRRRSFCHVKQHSTGDNVSTPISPGFPTYTAVAGSAKAKARSMSTPRQEVGFHNLFL